MSPGSVDDTNQPSQSAEMPESNPDAASQDGGPPPPPVPASDPRLAIVEDKGTDSPPPCDEHDIFKLPAVEALRLLSASVEMLVRMTGDIPPTPPPKTPTNPQMTDMHAEKLSIVRSHSQRSLAAMRQQAEAEAKAAAAAADGKSQAANAGMDQFQAYSVSMSAQLKAQQDDVLKSPGSLDGVRLRHHHSDPPPSTEPQPYIIVGADSQPVNLQHGAITRKFYSKKEPPISINQYLMRLHQFCPMSTAVYLATSLYIHRLAVEERAIPVTRRNAHRLVLAGLRVAMKALEDLSYPHTKIAKVGGVSEVELARLEISFCFLAGFELVVGEELLTKHWEELRGGRAQQILKGMEVPTLRLSRKPREVTTGADGSACAT